MPETKESVDALGEETTGRGGSWLAIAAVVVVTVLAIFIGQWVVGGDPEAEGASSEVNVAGAAEPPRIGETAPDFQAVDLGGAEESLAARRGKPVWVLFMASWCDQCRVEAPDVQQAHLEREDIDVVAVYLSESEREAGEYAERMGLTFTQVPDPAAEIAAAYGVGAIPAHYFVDADGVVREVAHGALSEERINELIDVVIGAST